MKPDPSREVDHNAAEEAASIGRYGQMESVASLVKRMGSPPSDLADHLSQQFAALCLHLERNEPSKVPKIDLSAWSLDSEGALIASDPETSFVLTKDTRPSVESLVQRFRTQLDRTHQERPQPAQSGKRSSSSGSQTDARVMADANFADDEHSDVEQARRDKIAELLTTSLIDRFGAEVVEAQDEEEVALKKRQQQSIQPDRRFNWNLVFGVGTAAVIVAMLYTGYRLTTLRQTRVDQQDGPDGVVPASTHSAESSDDWRSPEVGEVEPLAPSSTSVFSSNKKRSNPMNALETLESLNQSSTNPRPKQKPDSIDVSVDPSSLLAIDLPSGVVLASGASKEKPLKPKPKDVAPEPKTPKSGTLEQVLTAEGEEETPESPQSIRAADVRFVALPRTLDPQKNASVPGITTAFESISFPVDVPIRLDRPKEDDQTLTLVSVSEGRNLAEIITKESDTRFAWTESAKADSVANKIHHGKITTSDGGIIYMRPAIETDPIKLRMGVRDLHPSWDIGWPILPKVSRLEFDVRVPDEIEYAWVEAFDSSKPRRGRAILMITPSDGESVAIAVQLNVRCGSKLACHLRYAARLDPSQPWQPLTRAGLNQISNAMLSQRNSMATKRQTFEQFYNNADSVQRRLMRRKREQLEQAAEQIEATAKRIELLRKLAVTVEDRVRVGMRLFVQWPDGQEQTILKTVSPKADG